MVPDLLIFRRISSPFVFSQKNIMEQPAKRQKVGENLGITEKVDATMEDVSAQELFEKALKLPNSREKGKLLIQSCQMGHKVARLIVALGNSACEGCFESKNPEYEFDLELLQSLANDGDADAQWMLGRCYYSAHGGVSVDKLSAVKWYQLAANQGQLFAQRCLGSCYDFGNGVEVDKTEAFKMYNLAAQQGDTNAMFNVASCFDNGDGVTMDKIEAAKWYRLAAERGHLNAQFNLGHGYKTGDGIPEDPIESMKWFRLAAKQGDARAHCHIGSFYDKGNGVVMDKIEALKWYKLAAEQGDSLSQFSIGLLYYHGEGVKKDLTEAQKWFHLAALQGMASAQFNYGICLTDQSEALKWYRLAAEQGSSFGQCKLGKIYQEGVGGVTMDKSEALKWYQLAAEQGNIMAQFNLAQMYATGDGVAVDKGAAFKWYNLAAEQGLGQPLARSAAFAVGCAYLEGHGVKYDPSEAYKWWMRAAKAGNSNAEFVVGMCNLDTRGTVVQMQNDEEEGVKWLSLAAIHGRSDAAPSLGLYYCGIRSFDGFVDKLDWNEAIKWFHFSVDRGESWSQFCLGFCLCVQPNVTICDHDNGLGFLWELTFRDHDSNKPFRFHVGDYGSARDSLMQFVNNHSRSRGEPLYKKSMKLNELAATAYWNEGIPSLQVLSGRAVLMNGADTSELPDSVLELLEDIREVLNLGGVTVNKDEDELKLT